MKISFNVDFENRGIPVEKMQLWYLFYFWDNLYLMKIILEDTSKNLYSSQNQT